MFVLMGAMFTFVDEITNCETTKTADGDCVSKG